jgi:hypothetical protein
MTSSAAEEHAEATAQEPATEGERNDWLEFSATSSSSRPSPFSPRALAELPTAG